MKPWSVRIPAAIARGKDKTEATGCYIWRFSRGWQRRTITAGEVALAGQLAERESMDLSDHMAYTEKIERMSHD